MEGTKTQKFCFMCKHLTRENIISEMSDEPIMSLPTCPYKAYANPFVESCEEFELKIERDD